MHEARSPYPSAFYVLTAGDSPINRRMDETGPIPKNLSGLCELEELHLGKNELTGES